MDQNMEPITKSMHIWNLLKNRNHFGGKEGLKEMVLGELSIDKEIKENYNPLIPHIQINFGQIQDLSVKRKTLKLLEENIENADYLQKVNNKSSSISKTIKGTIHLKG